MGYACPVCEDPQVDAGHLANHLAFTALLRGGEHEAWLDDHVPEWEELDEKSLGETVADHADEQEFPQVFEDTTGGSGHSHDHGSGNDYGRGYDHGYPPRGDDLPPGLTSDDLDPGGGDPDERARDVLEEARELTRKRRENSEERE